MNTHELPSGIEHVSPLSADEVTDIIGIMLRHKVLRVNNKGDDMILEIDSREQSSVPAFHADMKQKAELYAACAAQTDVTRFDQTLPLTAKDIIDLWVGRKDYIGCRKQKG
jgi:hypothetical protein